MNDVRVLYSMLVDLLGESVGNILPTWACNVVYLKLYNYLTRGFSLNIQGTYVTVVMIMEHVPYILSLVYVWLTYHRCITMAVC